ncbi:MAG: phosphatidylserine decarboxylase family protein [Deltaproteobacteria bacterium]|uniref:Phosphatidylserine decarboxylase proenzyme n=1 Tax=Candidatus Zymogenus saltonus TaxID=2844893 RepID=A0A9D8KCJ6_9DELT|nr:phosphatidylserine decarboxylase family protein [Candidatus Zymogenus saltonus]
MKNQNTLFVVEGFPFIFAALVLTIVVAVLLYFYAPKAMPYVTIPLIILTLFVTAFFRNPNRTIPQDPRAVVSPADGKVIEIAKVQEKSFLNTEAIKISVFMSVFNVHVNRVPMAGKVVKARYFPGKFFVASLDKASSENERNGLVIENEKSEKILVVQIAGIVARRIVCYAKEGDTLQKGIRFGLIRFGSRLDLYLPVDSEIKVTPGEKVKGGETIMGVLP